VQSDWNYQRARTSVASPQIAFNEGTGDPVSRHTGRKRPWSARVSRTAALLMAYMALGSASAQMVTPGEFSVSAGGAAVYQIKLRVPQGIAGVVPDLSLVYNSQGGSGLLGVGWSLAGLSGVTRCPQTNAQDGSAWVGGINFTATDRYCMDGQRLIAVGDPAVSGSAAGTYGANNTYYATEMESFSKIQSFGSVGSGTAQNGASFYGPSYFVVKTKSGLKLEYGNTTDSKVYPTGKTVVAVWALNKVTDTKGNYMTLTYSAPDSVNGQYYPLRIDYTGNASVTPNIAPTSRIDFEYNDAGTTTRPDAAPVFVGGSLLRTTVRMTKVTMSNAGTSIREYRIAYLPSPAAPVRSFVQSIQECAPGSGGACLPATMFAWTSPQTNWVPTSTVGAKPATPVDQQCLTGDYDGDGLTDVACLASPGTWHMMLARSGGWALSYWQNGAAPASPVGAQCVVGDFNGDGKSDFACYNAIGQAWQMTFSTGSSWSTATWTGANPGVPVGNQCFTGDYDGDGRTDLACYTGNGSRSWHVTRSTGTGWASSYWGNGPDPASPVGNQCLSGDFNGDGKADFACYTGSNGNWHVAFSTGSGWTTAYWGSGPSPSVPVTSQCMTGDFNGDGKTDLACFTGNGIDPVTGLVTPGTWHVALATGAGWNANYWADGALPGLPVGDQCRTGDFNGDGKSDMACMASSDGTTAVWQIVASSGTGWVTSSWSGGPAARTPIGDQCLAGEFTGDGKTDLVCLANQTTGAWLLAAPDATFNGLLSGVSRSLGPVATPTYKSPAQTLGDRFTRNVSLTAPQRSVVPSAPLVVDVDVPNGIGGTRRTSHWYDTAVAEPETGRGFLGFKSKKTVDVSTGISATTKYLQNFPFAGQVDTASTTTGAGGVLTSQSNAYTCLDPATGMTGACVVAAGRRYFVYANQATARAWDLNGAGLPGSRTTNSSLDAYGNFRTVTTETLDTAGNATEYSKTVTNTFFNDPSAWVVGRLQTSTVASKGPDKPAVVTPGSGSLPATPSPQLPPQLAAQIIIPIIMELLLSD